ncbi:MAG: lamin tail domain-containing protein [Bacteroidota bacterium]
MFQRLLFIGLLLAGFYAASAQTDLIISEINYNNPGTDSLEFIELYNKGNAAIDLTGYSFSRGVEYNFPNISLDAGSTLVIALDSAAMQRQFGITARQWDNGALVNGGEQITLVDASSNVVDAVEYDNNFPWPVQAGGEGSSLVLCDLNADNSLSESWYPSFDDTGVDISGTSILASPGSTPSCSITPYVSFNFSETTVNEDEGAFFIQVVTYRGSGNGSEATTLDVGVDVASTATQGSDFTLPSMSIDIPDNAIEDTLLFEFVVVDDTDEEPVEIAGLTLSVGSSTLTRIYPNGGSHMVTINDNDRPLERKMIITGIFDSQPAGAGAKGVELYVLEDIDDIGNYGLGSANNGLGTDNEEFSFPAGVSATAGDCIYITDDQADFEAFFGFAADYESGAMSINGDDAIELFENSQVIDVFGDINMDGSGEVWDYLDGWAYRRSGTTADGSTFNPDNWQYSGVGALLGFATNAATGNPMPICAYSVTPPSELIAVDDEGNTPFETEINIAVLSNDVLPNSVTSLRLIAPPPLGSASIVPTNVLRYTPPQAFCGQDVVSYEVCDAFSCDTAVVRINVGCEPEFPLYDIDLITSDDNDDGITDSLGATCTLKGIVHGVDLRGGPGVQFTMIDATGGIAVFDFDIEYYEVTEGDEVTISGTIGNFNGLAQMLPDTIIRNSQGNSLVNPMSVTELSERTESELVTIGFVSIVDSSEWTPGAGSGFNVRFANQDQDTFLVRIDNDIDLFNETTIPGAIYFITGIGGQFDTDNPPTGGYQLLPRYARDISPVTSVVDRSLGQQVRFFPNPANEVIWIESQVDLDDVIISNVLGQEMIRVQEPSTFQEIIVSGLPTSIYTITFRKGNRIWSDRVVIE